MAQKNKKRSLKKTGRRNMNRQKKTIFAVVACAVVIVIAAVLILYILLKEEKQEDESDNARVHEFEPYVEDFERMDADYEQWLAASVITCISMESPDFTLGDVYASAQTTIDNRMESQGVYVMYETGGETCCIQSVPLEQGRTDQPGTKDVYSEYIGYATFDQIPADTVDTGGWHIVDMQELNTLIEQSVRVTLNEN